MKCLLRVIVLGTCLTLSRDPHKGTARRGALSLSPSMEEELRCRADMPMLTQLGSGGARLEVISV